MSATVHVLAPTATESLISACRLGSSHVVVQHARQLSDNWGGDRPGFEQRHGQLTRK